MENYHSISDGKSGYFIYFAAFAASLITVAVGTTMSWTSPVLPKLQSNDTSINPLSTPITTLELTIISTSLNMGALITSIIGGIYWDKLGKKRSLLLLTGPVVGSHVLCIFACNVYMFIAIRALMGITAAGVFGLMPAYFSEIAEVKERGFVGSMFGAGLTVGLTFAFIVGPFLSIRMFSLVNLIIPLLFLVLFGWFVPECPYDLVRRGQPEQALKALVKFRGKSAHHLETEFALISDASFPTKRNWLVLLSSRPLKKALIISLVLVTMEQFTGICAITVYMQSIFESAGSSISPIYAPMIISCVQMVSNSLSSFLVDRAGRRPLLITSTISCILSLGTFGVYFQVKALGIDVRSYGWLPLATMFIFMIAYNVGLANIPWIMSSELFPSNVKAISSSVVSSTNILFSFVVGFIFPTAGSWLGLSGPFFIFTAVLFMGLVFVLMVVPETKGKDFVEISRLLEGDGE